MPEHLLRDLGDGLVVRLATEHDVERLAHASAGGMQFPRCTRRRTPGGVCTERRRSGD